MNTPQLSDDDIPAGTAWTPPDRSAVTERVSDIEVNDTSPATVARQKAAFQARRDRNKEEEERTGIENQKRFRRDTKKRLIEKGEFVRPNCCRCDECVEAILTLEDPPHWPEAPKRGPF